MSGPKRPPGVRPANSNFHHPRRQACLPPSSCLRLHARCFLQPHPFTFTFTFTFTLLPSSLLLCILVPSLSCAQRCISFVVFGLSTEPRPSSDTQRRVTSRGQGAIAGATRIISLILTTSPETHHEVGRTLSLTSTRTANDIIIPLRAFQRPLQRVIIFQEICPTPVLQEAGSIAAYHPPAILFFSLSSHTSLSRTWTTLLMATARGAVPSPKNA